jgi:hypothetical protein
MNLTVVLHELGHTLGLPDGWACGGFADLMRVLDFQYVVGREGSPDTSRPGSAVAIPSDPG